MDLANGSLKRCTQPIPTRTRVKFTKEGKIVGLSVNLVTVLVTGGKIPFVDSLLLRIKYLEKKKETLFQNSKI